MPKKKRRKPKLTPPLGPPQNLRPAGAHESKKRYDRKRDKPVDEPDAGDDDNLSS